MIQTLRSHRTTWLAGLGSGLEYYDFAMYALLAHYLNTLYFPDDMPWQAGFQAFVIFIVGYWFRPLGGLVFGAYADRYGRKPIFMLSLGLMGFATLLMGLLPTYRHWGLWAPACLLVLRAIQSMTYGVELPGAMALVSERSDSHHKRLNNSLLLVSVALGAVLAALVLKGLTTYLTPKAMLEFGWRLPFIFGGLLAFLALLIRKQLEESPVFLQGKPVDKPIQHLFKHHRWAVLRGVGLMVGPACLTVFFLFSSHYLPTYFQYSLSSIYSAISLGLLWSVGALLGFGYGFKGLSSLRLFRWGAVLGLVLIYPLFLYVKHVELFLFGILYQTLVGCLAACYPSVLADLFKTEVRCTGMACCYNLGFALAALLPPCAETLVKLTGDPLSLVWVIMAAMAVSLVSVLDLERRMVNRKN